MSQQVGIRFTDNNTGIGSTIPVTVEKSDQSLSTLLANTANAKDGFLTSVELVSNFQGAILIVKANGKQIAEAKGSGNNQANFPRTPLSQLTINLSLGS